MDAHRNTKSCVCLTFDSFREMVEAAASGRSSLPDDQRSSRLTTSDRLKFTWTGNFPDAIKLARNGWPEGRKDAEKLRADIQAKGETRLADEVVYDVAGDEPDVARFLDGEPECMRRFESIETPTAGRIVRIVVNVSAACDVPASFIAMRGAAALAIIDSLEAAGFRCEVVIAGYTINKKRTSQFFTFTTIKKAQDVVDIDTMAFAMGHPSVLRRLLFSLAEQQSPSFMKAHHIGLCNKGGYGYSLDVEGKDCGDIYLPTMRSKDHGSPFASLAQARAWVASECARVTAKAEQS